MNKPYILILVILLSFPLFSQNSSQIDSLLAELDEAKEDTIKVEILLRLFSPTVINDLELAYEYADQAHQLSQKLSFDKGIAAAYQRKGIYWSYKGDLSKARLNYQQAIKAHEKLNQPLIAATLTHNLGLLFQEQGIYDSAEIFVTRASEIFLQHKDSLKYGSSLDVLSSIYEEKGYYYQSLEYATRAAELFHKYQDELREADALVKIATGYKLNEKHQLAIDYYMSAIQLYRKHNDQHWENYTLQKIADSYRLMDELEMADSVIDASLSLSEDLGSVQVLSEGYEIKGDIFFQRQDFQRALEYYDKALTTNSSAGDLTFNSTVNISRARCLQELGLTSEALSTYLAELPVSKEMDVKENLKTIYLNLAGIYEKERNTNQAYSYFKKYEEVKDSIYGNEKSRLFADLQVRYDTERKEREIAMQQQEITILEQRAEIQELLRMRLIVTIIVVIIFFLLGLYALWQRMKKNRLKQEMENERLSYELDLKKRELTTQTLHIIQKNELLENLQEKMAELKKKDTGASFHEITQLINSSRLIEKDWENFSSVFEEVHPDFFAKLKTRYTGISSSELRLAAMMKMNLNTKEMASILNISPESVKKARYRMRKKLELASEENVAEYFMNF